MRILNLYAGIGGNRKLWEGHEVIAVESDEKIAAVYKKLFPNDKVIIADAHQYLLDHFNEFDFIWSSPPCPTHSRARFAVAISNIDGSKENKAKPIYPDIKLYEEIILLMHYCPQNIKWVIENVRGYYNPLIRPVELHRHYFWSNFPISKKEVRREIAHQHICGSDEIYGFSIKHTDIENKRLVLRNMVDPTIGLHILELATKKPQLNLP